MKKKDDKHSSEDLIIKYLYKNKNFFLNNQKLLENLSFPKHIINSKKVISLDHYRTIKIKKNYEKLKQQFTEILKAANSHFVTQRRILKTSLKILNTKTLDKLIFVMVNDLSNLLDCDIVNCFFTSEKIKNKRINQIDNKIATNFFRQNPQIYLNQNPKGIPLFFPNKRKIIKSYMLLKVVYGSDRFILALGSKNINKFNKEQKVDLVEYLIQVIQIKLIDIN
tara:strand:- start:348 stop:1016 length:669 start_codon:yes stop_codon:yes gene_type:complete